MKHAGLWTVLGFSCLLLVPFMGKAYHIDEPFFLAIAGHILRDPLRPLTFVFNWYGQAVPMAEINNTPPLFPCLLALALKMTGGREWLTRFAFLPFDLLAAAALYLSAARFLKRPLLPVLIILAMPAYLINMGHLMPEKPAAAFGFAGLYALLRALDDDRGDWYWGSALLLGASLLSKYLGAVFLLPAAGYALHRKVAPRRIAAYLALSAAPLAAVFLIDAASGGSAGAAAWTTTAKAAGAWWSGWFHKSRAFLAFVGGCGVVTAFWPYSLRRGRTAAAVCAAAAAALFLPMFDSTPVRVIDRLTGIILASGGLLGLARMFSAGGRLAYPPTPGWALWAPWVLSASMLQLAVYWSVMSRAILFLLPPLVFWMAEVLENEWSGEKLRRLYGLSLAGTLALTLSLALADYRCASAQASMARQMSEDYISKGRKVWFTGHWGLQYYMERSGAAALDWSKGGWDETKPGDMVLTSVVNSNQLVPKRPLLSNVRTISVGFPVPLRLLSGFDGQGAFYSSSFGFLPFSLSREPLEEFRIVERL
ncbi:MAG: glycosyltransferase family 39 protein [Elusimicrobia bacterium]|nr:glycosyltransferase family 39 protein [Elusimicrobiota bacterium]